MSPVCADEQAVAFSIRAVYNARMPCLAFHADYVQLTSSHGQSNSSAVRVLEDVTVHRHIFNHGIQMRSEVPSLKTVFGLVAPPASAVSFSGMRWTSDDI